MNTAISRDDSIRQYLDAVPREVLFQSVMLGQGRAGKSSIIYSLNRNDFTDIYDPTTSDQFRMFTTIEKKQIRFEGEITAGPARDPSSFGEGMLTPYLEVRHCDVCIFVYDITDRTSFDDVLRHRKYFYVERSIDRPRYGRPPNMRDPPRPPYKGLFFAIATKIDAKGWQVSLQEGKDLSASIGAHFLQMSPKTGKGAGQDALKYIANLVVLNTIRHGHVSEIERAIMEPRQTERKDFSFDNLRRDLDANFERHGAS